MIQALTFVNRFGRSLRCILTEPERSGFAIKQVDGLGPGMANVNIHDIVTTDGGYFGSARFSARSIEMILQPVEANFAGTYMPVEETRHLSYEFFAPKTQLRIVIETDTRVLAIEGYVEKNEPDIFNRSEVFSIGIRCPEYYFRLLNEAGSEQHVAIYGSGLFEFPFQNNSLTKPLIEFGMADATQGYDLLYEGDTEAGFEMVITFNGEQIGGNITIQNELNGNSDNGPVGFPQVSDARSVWYQWTDPSLGQQYIKISTTKLTERLNGKYSGNFYDVGNQIVYRSYPGKKTLLFRASDFSCTILDCVTNDAVTHQPELSWMKLYPGYNHFLVTSLPSAVGKFAVNITYEALYSGV